MATGAEWPEANQVVSPCPTLQMIGSVTDAVNEREEEKRMQEMPGFNADGTPIKKQTITNTEEGDEDATEKKVGLFRRIGRFAKRRVQESSDESGEFSASLYPESEEEEAEMVAAALAEDVNAVESALADVLKEEVVGEATEAASVNMQ